jgi:hypothetical protein
MKLIIKQRDKTKYILSNQITERLFNTYIDFLTTVLIVLVFHTTLIITVNTYDILIIKHQQLINA